jgi:hypothetical protein
LNAHADKNDTVCVLSASWLNYYFDQRVIDLRGALYGHRKPTFRWPNDQLWTEWMDYENVQWLLVFYQAPELTTIPKQDPATNPFWPNYQLVYSTYGTWVFRRKPVPPRVSLNVDAATLEGGKRRVDLIFGPGRGRAENFSTRVF